MNAYDHLNDIADRWATRTSPTSNHTNSLDAWAQTRDELREIARTIQKAGYLASALLKWHQVMHPGSPDNVALVDITTMLIGQQPSDALLKLVQEVTNHETH